MRGLDPRTDVAGHFDRLSNKWSSHYRDSPRDVPELDLLLRRSVALDYIRRQPLPKAGRLRLLDVGCGSGDLLTALNAETYMLFGADVASAMLAQAAIQQPRALLLSADATRLPLVPESFDVVTSLGVLEYVPDWERALRAIQSVLRRGGVAILSFPNRQSLFRRVGRFEAAVARCLRRALDTPRRNEWTTTEVRRALAQAGFLVEDMCLTTYGLKGRIADRIPLNLAVSKWIGPRGDRDSLLSRNFAWTITVLCRKVQS